jgi:hypothetical protein
VSKFNKDFDQTNFEVGLSDFDSFSGFVIPLSKAIAILSNMSNFAPT